MSFGEFVEGCSPRLFRTALLLAGQDRAMAEDLLQLALERAYRHGSALHDSRRAHPGHQETDPRDAGVREMWHRYITGRHPAGQRP